MLPSPIAVVVCAFALASPAEAQTLRSNSASGSNHLMALSSLPKHHQALYVSENGTPRTGDKKRSTLASSQDETKTAKLHREDSSSQAALRNFLVSKNNESTIESEEIHLTLPMCLSLCNIKLIECHDKVASGRTELEMLQRASVNCDCTKCSNELMDMGEKMVQTLETLEEERRFHSSSVLEYQRKEKIQEQLLSAMIISTVFSEASSKATRKELEQTKAQLGEFTSVMQELGNVMDLSITNVPGKEEEVQDVEALKLRLTEKVKILIRELQGARREAKETKRRMLRLQRGTSARHDSHPRLMDKSLKKSSVNNSVYGIVLADVLRKFSSGDFGDAWLHSSKSSPTKTYPLRCSIFLRTKTVSSGIPLLRESRADDSDSYFGIQSLPSLSESLGWELGGLPIVEQVEAQQQDRDGKYRPELLPPQKSRNNGPGLNEHSGSESNGLGSDGTTSDTSNDNAPAASFMDEHKICQLNRVKLALMPKPSKLANLPSHVPRSSLLGSPSLRQTPKLELFPRSSTSKEAEAALNHSDWLMYPKNVLQYSRRNSKYQDSEEEWSHGGSCFSKLYPLALVFYIFAILYDVFGFGNRNLISSKHGSKECHGVLSPFEYPCDDEVEDEYEVVETLEGYSSRGGAVLLSPHTANNFEAPSRSSGSGHKDIVCQARTANNGIPLEAFHAIGEVMAKSIGSSSHLSLSAATCMSTEGQLGRDSRCYFDYEGYNSDNGLLSCANSIGNLPECAAGVFNDNKEWSVAGDGEEHQRTYRVSDATVSCNPCEVSDCVLVTSSDWDGSDDFTQTKSAWNCSRTPSDSAVASSTPQHRISLGWLAVENALLSSCASDTDL